MVWRVPEGAGLCHRSVLTVRRWSDYSPSARVASAAWQTVSPATTECAKVAQRNRLTGWHWRHLRMFPREDTLLRRFCARRGELIPLLREVSLAGVRTTKVNGSLD